LDQGDRTATGAAKVGEVAGSIAPCPEPAGWPAAEQTVPDEIVDDARRLWPEQTEVGIGQRKLRGGCAQVWGEHVRVVRVEHRRLDRLAEHRVGMMHDVGV